MPIISLAFRSAPAKALVALSLSLPLMVATFSVHAQDGAQTATQVSVQKDVTVKVTPKAVGADNARWQFTIVLDTHSADLSDDLTQSATLTTDDGRTFKPVSWTGAAPGGHHREGVLAFEVSAPRPSAIELRIDRPDESAPRTFRWQL